MSYKTGRKDILDNQSFDASKIVKMDGAEMLATLQKMQEDNERRIQEEKAKRSDSIAVLVETAKIHATDFINSLNFDPKNFNVNTFEMRLTFGNVCNSDIYKGMRERFYALKHWEQREYDQFFDHVFYPLVRKLLAVKNYTVRKQYSRYDGTVLYFIQPVMPEQKK